MRKPYTGSRGAKGAHLHPVKKNLPPPSDLQQLTNIFEARLRTQPEQPQQTLGTDERAALIGRFADVLRRLSKLMNISVAADGPPGLDTVLSRLIGIVTDSLDADRSTLFLHDRETGELFSRVAEGSLVDEIRLSPDEGVAGAAFTSATSVIIDHTYADRRFNPEVDRRTGYLTRNILCVPVKSWDGQVIGVTQVLNKRHGLFNEEDQALLEALTSHASAMLENARLQENIAKAQRDEHQLLGMSQALSSELHLDGLLEKVVSITTDVLEAERSSLFLYDPSTDELWSKVAEGLSTDVIRIPANAGLAGNVFTNRRAINIPDAYSDPRFHPEVDLRTGFRTRSTLCAPIITKQGETIGVIQVLNKRGGPFGGRDERRLQALAAQAAIALDNARLFEDVLNERNHNERILKGLSNGVLTVDADDRVLTANEAALRVLNRTSGLPKQRLLTELFEEPSGRIAQALERVKAERTSQYLSEVDIGLNPASITSLNITITPMDDSPGHLPRYLLILEDITDAKRVKGTMSRYMPHEVVERVLQDGEAILGGVDQPVTILFADIGNFTSISERIGARATVAMLNGYFSEMTEVISRHGGIVDKYIGDAVMAVFGAPYPRPGDADNAVQVAIEMMTRLKQFNQRRAELRQDPIAVRVGISSGEVVAGNIGSPKRMDYTVIGNAVNIASRLEAMNKTYGTRVLISQSTYAELSHTNQVRLLDRIRVKGSQSPIDVYEVLSTRGQSEPSGYLSAFADGITYYRAGRWTSAKAAFEAALARWPGDTPADLYLDRISEQIAESSGGESAPIGGLLK